MLETILILAIVVPAVLGFGCLSYFVCRGTQQHWANIFCYKCQWEEGFCREPALTTLTVNDQTWQYCDTHLCSFLTLFTNPPEGTPEQFLGVTNTDGLLDISIKSTPRE